MQELLSRLSSAELTEWAAFERINGPLGGTRHDYNAGLITKAIYDVNTKKSKRRQLADYVITWWRRRRPLDGHDMLARVKSLNAELGGTEQ